MALLPVRKGRKPGSWLILSSSCSTGFEVLGHGGV